jgi:hypothetical protein
MKQFRRTTLSVMGLAVAVAVLSSIPAQAAGSSVIAHAFVPSMGFPNSDFSEFVQVQPAVRSASMCRRLHSASSPKKRTLP